jgi:hypothetical protein
LLTGRALGLSIPASQNLFVRVGQQGAAGAVVEAPTEIAQQMMERAQAGLPLDSEDAIAEYVEAGVLGGIIGAGVGGGLGAFRGPEAPAAPPAPPGATPPAAGPASAPTVPPAGPATPPVPPVAPPAPATVVNTRTVTVGGGPALLVTLSNGQVLALPASATQADIDAAVRQYNSAQKQIIPPAGPSVPPTQAPPAVPPVATQPTPGLTAQEEADVEAELQTGTPVEQTQALLRSLLGPRLRPNMYKKLETLGVGPDDPVVLSELEAYIPVYQRNQRLMEVDPGLPARLRRYIDETRARQAAEAASGQTQATAPTQGAQPAPSVETQPAASPEFVLEPAEPDGRGAGVPDYTPLTEAEAFEAAAELAAAARAAKPRPVGGTVAPTPAAPSGTETQPGALAGARRFSGPISDAEYRSLSPADQDRYLDEVGLPPPPASLLAGTPAASGVQVSGVDEAITNGAGQIEVMENGQRVPFKNFALSVAGDRAEVGMVERDGRTRRGIGRDAYIALGRDLAARGITLESSSTLYKDGLKLWRGLADQGFARRNPQTKRFEFVAAPTPALWASKDFDLPVEVLNQPPQAAPDGRLYQAIRDPATGVNSFVPLDELRMLGEPQTFNDLAVEQSTPPAAPLAPDTALRIRRQLRDAGIDPIDFVPLESQARLEQEYDQERARFEQQYAIRPDQRGAPYLRTPVDQWTGYDWFTARQEMPQETAALNAAFIARERGRAPMLDRLNNLAYELRQVAPELDEAISQDPLAVMNAALADRGIPEIEPMFRPQQGREAQPQTFNDLAVEQSTPPASSIALDPAYSQEAAEYAVRWAAIRAGIPQTPELLAEAANTLVAKGGNPVEVLESLYMPFDAPSDPRLQGVDPFGLAEEAIESVKARTLPPGAQVLAQGQRTPAGIIPRTPTFAEPDADLTEAERALGAAFERAVVPGPDVAPVVEPTQADIEALAAADRTLRTAWETRNPNLTEEMRAFIFPEDAVADPSTVEDRQTVRGLFLRGQKGQAKSAETIFGKYPTVVQGLDHIAELQSRDKNLTKIIDNKALDSETLVDPETDTALDYGNALDFFEQGIVGNTGANAAKWVKANLSPEANYYLRARIEQLKASEEAIKKRTTLDDPVAIADKGVNQQVSEFEQTYRDDLGQAATAPFMDINGATQRAAMGVAEDSKPVAMPDLPTNVTATEQELAAARTGLRLPPSRMRGWTGLEIAVAQNFEGITTRKQAQAKIDELSDADIAQMIEDRAVTNRFLGLFRRFKTVRQAAILDVPVPFMVRAALMNNNLKASILHIARTAADAEIRAIARTISANLANTNVQLVDPADPANRLEARAYGAYDPETDTVLLPNTGDITIQTLLHETGHAVTAAYIETNPNSAEVNALKALFSTAYTQVMPHMSSVAYREGGVTPTPEEVTLTEVKEFVVEIKSNMEMRNTLRRLALDDLRVPQKGVLLNALEWVNSVFRKIMRTLARRGPGPNALQGADFVINSIMTPQRAAGDVLFSRGARPGTGVSPLMAVVRPLRDTAMNPSTRQKYADDASTFLDTTNTIGARTLLGFLPPLAVGDIAAKVGVKDPYRMFELIQRRDGMFSRAAQTVDTMLSRLTGYYQQQQAEKRAFDTLTTDSTVENMDPSVDPTVPAVQDRNYTKFWLAFDVLDQGGNILRTERRWFDSPADRDNAIIRLNAKTPATRTRARMAGDARTPGELQTLQALKDRFNALSPEGQTMYRQLRDFYEARYDELWKVLQGQMDAILGTDPRTAAEAKQSLYVKLFDKGQIRPYFPLVREGDYWLEFSAFNAATNSTEVVKMSFETRGARDRMIAQLATAPEVQKDAAGVPIINQYMASDMAQTSFRTDALFVKNIMDVFDKFNASAQPNNKISDEVMNDIAALIVKAAPEGSMARQLHKRNNTPGYIEDAEVALHNKGYRLANAAARQVSSFAIRKQAQEYREAIAKNPSRSQQLVMEELIKSGDNALAPMDSPIERAAQAANRIAYGYTLLGNVSSFIVNLSSMANVIFPQLGGRYGFNKATSELTRASRLFLSSGTKRIVRRDGVDTKLSALPSIDNYYVMEENGDYVVRTDIQMDAAKRQRLERMAPLLKQMSERGMLHHSLFYDSLGLQDFAEGRSRSDKAYAFFGAPFHVVERMNRQATAIAAYELELQRLTTENAAAANPRTQAELQVEAANEAVYRTTEMNGGASLNTAPRFTQRGLMRVAMMYKSYGMTVTTLLFKTARQIVNNIYGSTPEMKAERDIAMRQMMGHLGITFLLAGAHGLPMFGLASVIYNMFKDDEELSFDEVVRLQTSEMFYKGPVNALTGFEISERVGLSELLYRANRYNSDPSAEETIVQLLGGPAWSTFSGIKRGLNDMREGEYYRGFESMLPLMVSNPMRAARFYFEGGVQTRGDNFIYEDLTSSELIGRALGFNSAELVRRQDRSSEMVRIGKGVQEKRTKLVERLFLARRAGDDEAAERAIQDIIEFNQTVGARFPPAVISSADVESSFDRRIDTIQEMVNGVSINPQVRDILALEYNAIQDGLTRY